MPQPENSSRNIVWHKSEVSRQDREHVLGQQGRLIWFTGLSGSGKSTVAARLDARLTSNGRAVYLLDGDNVRHGLCSDLGFTERDRRENVRRVGEVGRLFVDAGLITIAAFISPYREDRDFLRRLLPEGDFIEVYVRTELSVCEARDPKGMYAKARAGTIKHFTGVSAPYEPPDSPEVVIDTAIMDPDKCVDHVCDYLDTLHRDAYHGSE